MAVDVTLTPVSSGYNTSIINTNFQNIVDDLGDALSRSGNTPNEMNADIDMNGNDLLNVNNGTFDTLTVGGVAVSDLTASVSAAAASAVQAKFYADEVGAIVTPGLPIETQIHGATAKSPLVDNDEFGIADSAASYGVKKILWSVIKSTVFSALGGLIASATTKATPVDGDTLVLSDSAASGATKSLTWANIKTVLQATNDSLYLALASTTAAGRTWLTATSAAGQTSLLNAMVGDSGSGGAKGLAPAPATGTAAANKFLKADGTWATTPGAYYTGSNANLVDYPVGSYVCVFDGSTVDRNSTQTIYLSSTYGFATTGTTSLTGTWVSRGLAASGIYMFQRIA